MMDKVFDTLSYVAEKLNDSNIVWAVGASILLNQYGLIDKPNDIDILVALDDIDKADKILKSIGEKKVHENKSTYSTRHFYEYIINGFDVDVMAGLRINHTDGVFDYIFDSNSISEFRQINGVDVPFASLEDWYVIYQLIPNREAKAKMIENYLLSKGIRKPGLLERALEGKLTVEVRDRTEKLLRR